MSNGGGNGTFSYFDNRCVSVEEICSRFDLSYAGDRRHLESNFTQCSNGTHDIPLDQVRRKKKLVVNSTSLLTVCSMRLLCTHDGDKCWAWRGK